LHIALFLVNNGIAPRYISEHLVFLSKVAMQHGAVKHAPQLVLVLLVATR
jgi:hypothetical protein